MPHFYHRGARLLIPLMPAYATTKLAKELVHKALPLLSNGLMDTLIDRLEKIGLEVV